MLPNEAENRTRTRAAIGAEFELIQTAIALGVATLNRLISSDCHAEITKAMTIAILTREIRRLRSIAAIAELGFAENADILCRSMFEGLLAERFILRSPPPGNQRSSDLANALKSQPRMALPVW